MNEYQALITELEQFGTGDVDTAGLVQRAAAALRELTSVEQPVGRVPYKAILDTFNLTLGQIMPPVKQLTPLRRVVLAARWNENPEHQTPEFWQKFFTRIAASDFLAGRRSPGKGHANWRPSFDWVTKSENFQKIVEGNYDNRGPALDMNAITRDR